ncbi:MAG TPA: class II aldolase/adducin family protein [Polyangia bacterium]|jgi:L-fuculose-phosphate aldolase|nr:class II aldolase/adducin family protein [Polyangia bacterium]
MSDRAADVADYAQRLHARGWVANHDGNVSVRDGDGRYLATPTATSKAAVRADGLVIVDDAGKVVGGRGKVFGEIGLHLAIYRSRADVHAVIHAHPPTATGFAVAGVALDDAFIAEAVVSLGAGVPTVPFAAPGDEAARALADFTRDHDAVLLANHGVIAWGRDLETAFLRLELVEHLAKIALVARQLGGVQPLPASVLPKLLEARAKAGLGPNAVLAAVATNAPKTVVACAPAPPGSDVEVYDPKRARATALPSPAELASIIRQEIAAALKK